MGTKLDLTNRTFGNLTVLKETNRRCANGGIYWLCKCICGKEIKIIGRSLVRPHGTKSCISCANEAKKGKESPFAIDLVGKKFHRLKVIKKAFTKKGRIYWHCLCDCGSEKIAQGTTLKAGRPKSCGCYEKDHPSRYKHGGRNTRLYKIWTGLKERCFNPKWRAYNRYGGRGITICRQWLNDFSSFRQWALNNGYAKHLTIDRIDNDGNYEPSNCQWLTALDNIKKRWHPELF